ncbi:FixH family protein [Pseudohalioglobus sediminis]|uniref:FixH family protein n=1 Tax=Pseudohalioglobus sediminis TaxID=2606449 RepID=A0A5B0X1X3_9GAMM|nr:FixH family protein [Pseudohalioglobus sediminis]KAA1193374.1 FixH family protein [Pseudohalioglobus sediminis]
MSNQFPREDTQPWYRQFWPWFLIALPAFVVVAGINMVFIAHEGADDLVVDEYYKDGLAINRKLEKKQRAEELGISADVALTSSDVVVTTRGPVQAEQLTLLLSHPLESNRDFEVALVQSTPGEYRGRLQYPVAERWHWTLIFEGEEAWRLDGSITRANLSAGHGG